MIKSEVFLGKYKKMTIELCEVLDKDDIISKLEGVIGTILEGCSFNISEEAIDTRVQGMIDNFKIQLAASGITMEKYLCEADKDYDVLVEELRIIALEGMKKELALAEIAKAEGISVKEKEVWEKINEFAKIVNKTPQKMFEELYIRGKIDAIRKEILWGKINEFLLKNNTFKYNRSFIPNDKANAHNH
jgi:FKBP-type peptidyl-prolyl cis-trans isomerase (trigger factor)